MTATVRAPPVLRVLLVGQTPPPYGGQAVMIENMLRGRYRSVEISHVRMAFSRELRGGGRLSVAKVAHAVRLVLRIAAGRVRTGARVLYYAPAGPDPVPIYRDLVVLGLTRWMFEKTVLHFHAGGVSEAYDLMGRPLKALFRRAYFDADAGIRTSDLAPGDPARLSARREFVVPNGVGDDAAAMSEAAFSPRRQGLPVILFVGLLRESKGVFVLVEACAELRRRSVPFRLQLVGEFHSRAAESQLDGLVRRHGLDGVVEHRGVLVGEEKNRSYAAATVLCCPTYFESETFGLVLIEAMQFSLPIVATRWRGIPSVVEDGLNGFLVPVRDSGALAEGLARVITDPEVAERMGVNGRRLYEERYTLDRFHAGIQGVFDSLHPVSR